MSSRLLDTYISEIYNQKQGDCWIYVSVNMFMRFIIQVFKHFYIDKKFFEGKYTEKYKTRRPSEMLDVNDTLDYFKGLVSNIDDLHNIYTEGLVRKKMTILFLYGLCIKSKFISTDEDEEYLNKSIVEKEKNLVSICEGGFNYIALQHFINVLVTKKIKTFIIKEILIDYLLIPKTNIRLPIYIESLSKIFVVFYQLCNLYNLNPRIINYANPPRQYLNKTDKNPFYLFETNTDLKGFMIFDNISDAQIEKIKETAIISSLNQGVYFSVATRYIKDKSCIKCASNNKNKIPFATQFLHSEDGPHIMTCVGYDKMHKSLIIKNSWGDIFCDTGFFLINTLECFGHIDLCFIYSNLPEYSFLKPEYKLFNSPGKNITNSKTRSYDYPSHHKKVVAKSYKEIIKQYNTTRKLHYKTSSNNNNNNNNNTIKKTGKKCPPGYLVDKINKTICNKK